MSSLAKDTSEVVKCFWMPAVITTRESSRDNQEMITQLKSLLHTCSCSNTYTAFIRFIFVIMPLHVPALIVIKVSCWYLLIKRTQHTREQIQSVLILLVSLSHWVPSTLTCMQNEPTYANTFLYSPCSVTELSFEIKMFGIYICIQFNIHHSRTHL